MFSVIVTSGATRPAHGTRHPQRRYSDLKESAFDGANAQSRRSQAMRLLIVATLNGPLNTAAKTVMDKGASAIHADCIDSAMAILRSGNAADLLMVDIQIDIRDLVLRLEAARIRVPIVACGTRDDDDAIAAIDSGAKEYIPLPPDPEIIAAILAAVAGDTQEFVDCNEAMASVAHTALTVQAVTPALVGRTVADVERDLILETLKHCLGNRTHAANVLGISIRTLRNKLTEYAAEGVRVPPPNSGEVRGAA
jgi:DNA-binding NtrC family response regulator